MPPELATDKDRVYMPVVAVRRCIDALVDGGKLPSMSWWKYIVAMFATGELSAKNAGELLYYVMTKNE